MNKTYHLVLTTEPDGEILVHRADCPYVHEVAEDGYEIHSLFGCREPIMPGLRQHACLDQWGPGPSSKETDVSKHSISGLKRFIILKRLSDAKKDIPTERVCEGVVFPDNRIAVHWIEADEIQVWKSLEQMFGTLTGSEYGEDIFWDDYS